MPVNTSAHLTPADLRRWDRVAQCSYCLQHRKAEWAACRVRRTACPAAPPRCGMTVTEWQQGLLR